MTPSAKPATCRACAPLETPRPTATGRLVYSRVGVTTSAALELTAARVPVIPIRLTA